jgi:hypothetical protein
MMVKIFFEDVTNDEHPIARDEFIQHLVKNVYSKEWSLNIVVLVWVTLLESECNRLQVAGHELTGKRAKYTECDDRIFTICNRYR